MEKTIVELRREIVAKKKQARSLLDQGKVEEATDLVSEVEALDSELDLREKAEGWNSPIPQPGYTVGPRAFMETTSSVKGKDFRSMFGADLSRGEFKDFDEFLGAVASGRADARLEQRAMIEGVGSAGGFLVPTEFASELLDASLESEVVRPRAHVVPMISDTKKIACFDNSDHTNLYGGLAIQMLSEEGTATRQTGKTRIVELKAKKGAIYVQASREVLEDGMSFEEQLKNAMTSSLAFGMDYLFLQGTGAGEPLGILNDPALIVVSKEVSQAASTICYENCVKMLARLAPSCYSNAVWLANNTTIPEMLTMQIAIGTAGSFIPAVVRSNGQNSLLNLPLIFTEKLPSLGSKGDILLVDLSSYIIGLRSDLVIDRSNVPGWLTDMEDFRVIARFDGMGSWKSAITPKNGDSLSYCVTLAERA